MTRGVDGLKEFFANQWPHSYYVGEWHVHPEGPCYPRRTDDATLFKIVKEPKSQCKECILVIVVTRRGIPSVGSVHVYSKHGRTQIGRVTPF